MPTAVTSSPFARRTSPWLTTVGTPLVGAFAMTAWDLAFDPTASTIHQNWIWEDGGSFFDVPLVNYLGWTLTVYLFMQVFALYLRSRGPLPSTQQERTPSDLQALLLYAATTVPYFVNFRTGDRTTVTDATGATWNTADIYETSALLAVYGMGFIALLALVGLARRHTSGPGHRPDLRRPSQLRDE
jgi:Carotenoid biosynthesis protein